MSLPPTHLPPWAVFVAWAGTFAAGGPKRETFEKLVPTMPLGSFVAMLIVLMFGALGDLGVAEGAPMVIAEMVILFVMNSVLLFCARISAFVSFIPGMFFGFASYFATYFGGWGLVEGNAFHALWAVILMNWIGLLFAFVNAKTTRVADQRH